eukprot:6759876-Prymnesium_polylepis.1
MARRYATLSIASSRSVPPTLSFMHSHSAVVYVPLLAGAASVHAPLPSQVLADARAHRFPDWPGVCPGSTAAPSATLTCRLRGKHASSPRRHMHCVRL